jgi:hypothetical protein
LVLYWCQSHFLPVLPFDVRVAAACVFCFYSIPIYRVVVVVVAVSVVVVVEVVVPVDFVVVVAVVHHSWNQQLSADCSC